MLAWLFLVGSLWGAWFTWNAHRPIFDKPRLSVLGFFAGWLTKELAFHHLFWQAVVTLLFLALIHSRPFRAFAKQVAEVAGINALARDLAGIWRDGVDGQRPWGRVQRRAWRCL